MGRAVVGQFQRSDIVSAQTCITMFALLSMTNKKLLAFIGFCRPVTQVIPISVEFSTGQVNPAKGIEVNPAKGIEVFVTDPNLWAPVCVLELASGVELELRENGNYAVVKPWNFGNKKYNHVWEAAKKETQSYCKLRTHT